MSNDAKLTILIEEYKLINDKIEHYLRNQFRMMNIAFVLIGSFLGFAFYPNKEYAELRIQFLNYLPFFILIILSFVAYHYQRTMGFHGYKKYLEEQLNKIAEENIIFYNMELGLNQMIFHNALSGFILVSFGSCFIFAIIIAYRFVPNPVMMAFQIISGIVFAGCCWSINGTIDRFHSRATKFNSSTPNRSI